MKSKNIKDVLRGLEATSKKSSVSTVVDISSDLAKELGNIRFGGEMPPTSCGVTNQGCSVNGLCYGNSQCSGNLDCFNNSFCGNNDLCYGNSHCGNN